MQARMNCVIQSRIFIVYCVFTFIFSLVAECRGYTVNSSSVNLSKVTDKKCDGSEQFQCKSGQCIPINKKCDGYYDCLNDFDECNEGTTCADNSDENDCEKGPEPTGGCVLPNHPNYGKWLIQGRETLKPGRRVSVNTLLTYTCDKGYKLSNESATIACFEDGWRDRPPICTKLCPPLYTNNITIVRCYNQQRIEIKCTEASDASYATFDCARFYEPSDGLKPTRYCYQGRWSLPPPKCIPVCGEKIVTAVPLIVSGKNVVRGSYPWVTAIYIKNGDDWVNSCGGTMLSQKVILTAAHCVANEDGRPLDKSLFKIAVGKYYNEYMDPRDSEAQYSDVEKILVHEKYKGDSNRYSSDIAFIITKERLLFSKVVQPVCYSGISQLPLRVGMTGVVTGWGYTTAIGDPSNELKEVNVSFKDETTCSKELPSEWYNKYAVYDKFCARNYNKSIAICKGDGGGGLVFENTYKINQRYYVYGVLSLVRKISNVGCDIEVSALYTDVTKHASWLEEITSEYA